MDNFFIVKATDDVRRDDDADDVTVSDSLTSATATTSALIGAMRPFVCEKASIRSGCTATSRTLYVPGAHGMDMRFVRVTVD